MKNTEQLLKVINMIEFYSIFSIIFTMGTLKSVSLPQYSNRSTVLKVSPMVTEVTFAPLHKYNTCTVLKLFWLPVMTHTALFFICNAVSITCFWPLILCQERNWSTFSVDSRRAWAFLFFCDFFPFSVFLLVCWIQRQY